MVRIIFIVAPTVQRVGGPTGPKSSNISCGTEIGLFRRHWPECGQKVGPSGFRDQFCQTDSGKSNGGFSEGGVPAITDLSQP